ncbi:3-keto-5-aminohexanoate cleavage protein [Chloroflexota bacterium]
MTKIIVTAAVTGNIHTPSMSPYLPVTPDQIAENAIGAYDAGASMVHVHVRDPETGRPSSDVHLYKRVLSKIKSKCNVIVGVTTGGGLGISTIEQRLKVITELKPEIASFNAGSVNIGLHEILEQGKIKEWKYDWEESYLRDTEDVVFAYTFKTMKAYAQVFEECGTKQETEIWDSGFIGNVDYLVRKGYIKSRPIWMTFVLGPLGGLPPKPQTLMYLYETAKQYFNDGFNWQVLGAGRYQLSLCAMALVMGGNVRVGMEDSLFVGKGILAKNNAEQVEKIIRIIKELSLEVATPDEARQMLGLKGIDRVNY